MEKLRVLVADDEAPARRVLTRLLAAHRDITVIAECADGADAAARIRDERPGLTFLDVKMPELDGFEVVERVGVDAMPPVVFVTAFDDFALRAFDVRALDYLDKPFSDARFETTLPPPPPPRRRRVRRAPLGRAPPRLLGKAILRRALRDHPRTRPAAPGRDRRAAPGACE